MALYSNRSWTEISLINFLETCQNIISMILNTKTFTELVWNYNNLFLLHADDFVYYINCWYAFCEMSECVILQIMLGLHGLYFQGHDKQHNCKKCLLLRPFIKSGLFRGCVVRKCSSPARSKKENRTFYRLHTKISSNVSQIQVTLKFPGNVLTDYNQILYICSF